jgi:hypothetical protein
MARDERPEGGSVAAAGAGHEFVIGSVGHRGRVDTPRNCHARGRQTLRATVGG